MPEFLTTKSTASEIEKIIYKAKEVITIVSPFLKINKTFHSRLEDASERGIPIIVIYGKDELKSRERRSLEKIKTIRLHYLDNLHAKCYFNEKTLVITSMNMHDFSEQNNREMGVLITKKDDYEVYNDAINEAESILRVSDKEFEGTSSRKKNMTKSAETNTKGLAFCIRCENRIPYNIEKPYCRDCFYTWNEFENYGYEESVCHNCGEYTSSTMVKPECWNCYKKS